ncbi:MAG: hypothetical protein R2838_24985 [Caldilineaceae bacterium]
MRCRGTDAANWTDTLLTAVTSDFLRLGIGEIPDPDVQPPASRGWFLAEFLPLGEGEPGLDLFLRK